MKQKKSNYTLYKLLVDYKENLIKNLNKKQNEKF